MHYSTVYIGVNYHTEKEAVSWAEAIKLNDENALIIVVDNSEGETTNLQVKLRNVSEKIVYLDTKDNLGYLNGAYEGYKYLSRKGITFEWMFVTNVDVLLDTRIDEQVIEKMNSFNADILAPAIISHDTGQDKNPYRLARGSKTSLVIKRIAFSNFLFSAIYRVLSNIRNTHFAKTVHNSRPEGTLVYMPYGACLLFGNQFFDKGGTIKYPLFIFGEELFVAEQCYKLGMRIVYFPSIRFKNLEHASTSKLSSKYVTKRLSEMTKFILKEYY